MFPVFCCPLVDGFFVVRGLFFLLNYFILCSPKSSEEKIKNSIIYTISSLKDNKIGYKDTSVLCRNVQKEGRVYGRIFCYQERWYKRSF